ncbi:unnamed protein product, partial [Nesidiocoris tenuis]
MFVTLGRDNNPLTHLEREQSQAWLCHRVLSWTCRSSSQRAVSKHTASCQTRWLYNPSVHTRSLIIRSNV